MDKWEKGLKVINSPKYCEIPKCKNVLDKYKMLIDEHWICPECFRKIWEKAVVR